MKIFYKILSLALIMTLSLVSCTEDPEVTTGSINGIVTSSSGGTEPLSGVTVSIISTGQSTTTGSSGSFSFANLQAGSYSLQFTKSGYNTNTRTVNVIAGQSYQCDIQMSKVSQEANIEINPSSLNFGTTQTDLSVTIRNNGNTTADWSLELGNNHWLSVSQTGGSIQAGQTQSITFTVDRNYLSEAKTVVVNLQTFGNSYPIHISCAPKNTKSEMTIDPKELNFGSNLNEKTFTIRNTGKDALNWNVSNLQSDAISLSADKGTISGGGSSVVTVTLDREKFSGTLNTSFVISDGIKDDVMTVTANTAESVNIEINPSSLNFGTTQTDLSVTIKNNGNTTADWSLELGNNHWLSVSQTGGSIQAGKTQSIIFTVDRNYLSEAKTVVVNLQTFGNSYPIHISCAPRKTTSEMTIDPKELNFGSNLNEKTFTIRNTGIDVLNWSVSNIQSDAISLSAGKGTIPGGGNSVVTVTLDREKFNGTLNTSFVISDGIKDEVMTVTANTGDSGNDEPNNPVNPGSFVVRNGILAYFPFNGNFDDISGNDVYGYGSPDPTFTDGVTNGSQAISFSKMKENAFIVSHGLIDSRSMTICFWMKNISEGNIFYVTSSNKGNGGEEMMTFTYRDGHLKYVVSRYCNHYAFDKTGNFTHKKIDDGKWHHIALVFDYNKLNQSTATTTLYIDGRIMDTVTEYINVYGEAESSGKHFGTGTKFTLGGSGVPNIQIANMRVYDARQLSSDEIKTIYEAKQ